MFNYSGEASQEQAESHQQSFLNLNVPKTRVGMSRNCWCEISWSCWSGKGPGICIPNKPPGDVVLLEQLASEELWLNQVRSLIII